MQDDRYSLVKTEKKYLIGALSRSQRKKDKELHQNTELMARKDKSPVQQPYSDVNKFRDADSTLIRGRPWAAVLSAATPCGTLQARNP